MRWLEYVVVNEGKRAEKCFEGRQLLRRPKTRCFSRYRHGILKNTAAFVTFHPSLLKGRLSFSKESDTLQSKALFMFSQAAQQLVKLQMFFLRQ